MYRVMVADSEERDKPKTFLNEKNKATSPFHPFHKMPMYYKKVVSIDVTESLALKRINFMSYPELNIKDMKNIRKQL